MKRNRFADSGTYRSGMAADPSERCPRCRTTIDSSRQSAGGGADGRADLVRRSLSPPPGDSSRNYVGRSHCAHRAAADAADGDAAVAAAVGGRASKGAAARERDYDSVARETQRQPPPPLPSMGSTETGAVAARTASSRDLEREEG